MTKEGPTLREWLAEGPFALALSAGFFGFYAHAGVLSALEESGLLPHRVSGASAGALVGAGWAAGIDAPTMREALLGIERRHFWDPAPGLGLLRGRLFRERLEEILPVDALERCRVPAAISVFDTLALKTRVLSSGPLAKAICASCAVPLFFHPVWIDGRPYLDGGTADRPGLLGLRDEPRVLYHHLPSRRRPPVRERLPAREGLVALVLHGLAQPGPFRLEEGERAFRQALRATRAALKRPVDNGAVVLEVGD